MSNTHFIIIDEYSMIGCTLLAMIEKRCSQAKESNSKPFGDLCVILLGDIDQLSPVKDLPVYNPKPKSPLSQHGKAVFDQYQKCILLHQCHRQKDERFRLLLDNISSGDISEDDFQLLCTRFVTSANQNGILKFSKVLRLFSTIDEVNTFNLTMLKAAKDTESEQLLPVARVPAQHNCKMASIAKPEDADGLEKVLYLCKGCKVMLSHNLWTSKGLVNGAIGAVVDILYESGQSSPDDLPGAIICSFPSYIGPSLLQCKNVVAIGTATSTWITKQGVKCSRKQFPLSVAYACSIHKSQGMTLHTVIVDLGKREFALGLTYVALSRVRTLEGLLLHPICCDRISKIKSYEYMAYRCACKSKLEKLQ